MSARVEVSPWFPCYAADTLADAARLSLEEYGALRMLEALAWREGGIAADEPGELARLLRVPPKRAATLWAVIGRGWERTDSGRYVLPDMEMHRAAAAVRRSVAQQNGRKGGRPAGSARDSASADTETQRVSEQKPNGLAKQNPDESFAVAFAVARAEDQGQGQEQLRSASPSAQRAPAAPPRRTPAKRAAKPAQLALDSAAVGGAAPNADAGPAAPDPDAAPPEDSPTPEPEAWWVLLQEWQRRKGVVTVGEWRKFVGPLCVPGPDGEPPYPVPLLRRAIEVAAARTRGTRQAAFLTPRSFAADIVEHVRYARMPIDELMPHLPVPASAGSANGHGGPRANGARPDYAHA